MPVGDNIENFLLPKGYNCLLDFDCSTWLTIRKGHRSRVGSRCGPRVVWSNGDVELLPEQYHQMNDENITTSALWEKISMSFEGRSPRACRRQYETWKARQNVTRSRNFICLSSSYARANLIVNGLMWLRADDERLLESLNTSAGGLISAELWNTTSNATGRTVSACQTRYSVLQAM